MTPQDHAARGWPSFARLPHMVQQAPGVWVRAVHVAPDYSSDITDEGCDQMRQMFAAKMSSEEWDVIPAPFIPPAELIASGFPVPRIGVPLEEMAQLSEGDGFPCDICHGTQRVCEYHPFRSWPKECQCGAGMHCPGCVPLEGVGEDLIDRSPITEAEQARTRELAAELGWTGADGGLDDMGRRWPLDDHHGDGA